MNTATDQVNNATYNTVQEVNVRLNALGFKALTAEQAKKIQQDVPRERFIRALNLADKDAGALKFLSTLVPVKDSDQNDQGASPDTAQASGEASTNQGSNNSNVYNMNDADAGNTQPSAPPANAEQGGQSASNREFINHHVYGSKAALDWNVDETKKEVPTIRLEAAGAVGERAYDWKNKVSIQLTRDELPCVAAVFLGILESFEAKNHGVGDQKGKKGFSVHHQGTKVFARVWGPGKHMAVQITPEDCFSVASLLLRQIRKGKPWLSSSDIMTLLRAIIGRMKAPQGES